MSSDDPDSGGYLLVTTPNRSLTRSGRRWVLCGVFGVSAGIASWSAWLGAWPVFPFAGLEMLVLYGAFNYLDRHTADYEWIEIRGDAVHLEFRDGRSVRTRQMNRLWTQVELGSDPVSRRCRVALRSRGECWEIGRFLADAERLRLAQELRRQLRRAQ